MILTAAHEEVMQKAAELQVCPVAGPWNAILMSRVALRISDVVAILISCERQWIKLEVLIIYRCYFEI